MADNVLKSQAFKLKGRLYTFTVLQVLDSNPASYPDHLAELVSKAPGLFDKTPVVLDCSSIDAEHLDLPLLCALVKKHGFLPVAIQSNHAGLNARAQEEGLAVLNASSAQDKSLLKTIKTKLLNTPVRSGQQVVSKAGDLVVTAAVSHGAELLADGHIHVYGALRGRALAGISGNKEARIFCQSLDAEMLAIAGFYRLREAIEPCPVPCQIYLQDDQIQIEPL
ncbi:MAG: septum site-determining protein MinC [Legionellaceae bacterium]